MDISRSKLFDDDFDVSDFTPKPVKKERQNPDVATKAADATGFKSREAKVVALVEKKPEIKQRRRRTGRNAQLNLKAKPETISEFCDIADKNGWGLGETLEQAVELLRNRSIA